MNVQVQVSYNLFICMYT